MPRIGSPLVLTPCVMVLSSAALVAGVVAGVVAGSGSDECAQATLITVGTYSGDTSQATTDGNADCAESSASPDVWYEFVPEASSILRLSLCGSDYDTMLSIHSGCPGNETNQLACNDDFDCDGDGDVQNDGYVSFVQLPVDQGTSYFIRVSGWNGASGSYALDVEVGPDLGADVLIGEINEFVQFGRRGSIIGCAVDSPVCNAGTEPLDWYPLDDGRHPFMVFNMYRLMNGRMEQIGQSWVKHGFASAQANACGLGCIAHPDSTRTGVGCSDTYNAATNANQQFLGPRTEIDPWMPSYTFAGSHLDVGPDEHDGIEHRLQIDDADLDPVLNSGAQFFCELYVLAHDDADHLNSIAHEQVSVSGAPGETWSFDVSSSGTELGPAIGAWPGATSTVIPEAPADDGRVFLAAKATDLGDGVWHYEYALYNHDMSRAVRSVSVPVGAATTVTNIGFHAVRAHDEQYTNEPWTSAHEVGAVTWATQAFESHPRSNPLRWGTTYNFRFDADAAPAEVSVTLGAYFPGGADEISGRTIGPAVSCAADLDGDGEVGFADLLAVLSAWGPCAGCPEDLDGDDEVGFGDLLGLLASWGMCR